MQDIGSGMLSVGIIIVEGAKVITDAFLNMVGDIIHGAADAFGWVPGLGGKLQGAASAFDSFIKVLIIRSTVLSEDAQWQSDLTGANHTASTLTNQMTNDFKTQASNAKTASSALSNYSDAIKTNGVNSSARSGPVSSLSPTWKRLV